MGQEDPFELYFSLCYSLSEKFGWGDQGKFYLPDI